MSNIIWQCKHCGTRSSKGYREHRCIIENPKLLYIPNGTRAYRKESADGLWDDFITTREVTVVEQSRIQWLRNGDEFFIFFLAHARDGWSVWCVDVRNAVLRGD